MNSRAAGSGVVKGMVKDLKTKYNKEKCGDIVIVKKVTNMTEKKIREVIDKFAEEAKRIYGIKLEGLILYGSCARGDFQNDSDIDILILLNVPLEDISSERNRILDISDKLDLEYDVVLAPVVQNYELYQKYIPVSSFYQNVEREGVKIA